MENREQQNDNDKGDKGHVCHAVHFLINGEKYESGDHTLTGAQLKGIAGVPASDELFLEGPCGDEVIPNDATVLVRDGDKFHSMPSPQYGDSGRSELSLQIVAVLAVYTGEFIERTSQDRRLILRGIALPDGYSAKQADVLVRVPPLFPEARPDMFWTQPVLALSSGGQPQATSIESIDGESWQRFSWHLAPEGWRPGISTLRDFVRAVVARLHRVG